MLPTPAEASAMLKDLEAWRRGLDPELAQESRAVGNGWATLDPDSQGWYPSQNRNRFEYVSMAEPEELEEAMDLYRDRVDRCFFYKEPDCAANQWLKKTGFKQNLALEVLGCGLKDWASPAGLDLLDRVRPATLKDAAVIHAEDPKGFRSGFGRIGDEGVRGFVIESDEGLLAWSMAWVRGEAACLGHAFTQESHRRKGAQSALIAARLAWCQAMGAKIAFAETYAFLPSSFENLLRAGFAHLYGRVIHRWEASPTQPPQSS